VASLNELFVQARGTRLHTRLLRAEMHRLTARNAAVRRDYVERRKSCGQTARRATLNREYLPTWPAWSAPGPELRSTLVPLE
jgi:hypothetical protein